LVECYQGTIGSTYSDRSALDMID